MFGSSIRFRSAGFTLVEMLVVMVIIAILAGLILMGAGHAQKTSARKRAASEIAAMEAAAESYKADNGIYPLPKTQTKPPGVANQAASRALYQALSGDGDDALSGGTVASDGKVDADRKQYMEFKPTMLGNLTSGTVTGTVYIADPFGTTYGYYAPDPAVSTSIGYNPTFDLWSTGGGGTDAAKWITNW